MSRHKTVFAHRMDTTSDFYLARPYLMKIAASNDQEITTFITSKTKNKTTSCLLPLHNHRNRHGNETFEDTIGKHNYAKNDCFINSNYDFHHDSLLNAAKQRNVITHATILKTIGKTWEDAKEGLCIQDVLPSLQNTVCN